MPKPKKKDGRGGAREGAGRKPRDAEKLSVKLDSWVIQWYDDEAKRQQISVHKLQSDVLTNHAKAGGAKPPPPTEP